jgi:hypothetical protein
VIVPLLGWLGTHGSRHWLVANLVAACGIFALHALAQLDVVFRHERRLSTLDAVLMHLNGYALVGGSSRDRERRPRECSLGRGGDRGGARALRGSCGGGSRPRATRWPSASARRRLRSRWLDGLAHRGAGRGGGLVIWLRLTLATGWYRIAGAGLLLSAILRYGSLSLPVKPAVFTLFGDEAFAMGAAIAAVFLAVAWLYRR